MATISQIHGLSFAKGQRLKDLLFLNLGFTNIELLKVLTELVKEEKLLSYQEGGTIFYKLPP